MKPSASLASWRDYFRRADSDIFEIIDHAIMVASVDCPKEFKSRRDKIAELLFSCRVSRCTGCDRLELAVPSEDENSGGDHSDGDGGGDHDGYDGLEPGGSKESKANSSRGDNHVDDRYINNNQIVSNYSYGDAEALSDEIEEASQMVAEVLRIKDILLNNQDESNSVLFESLRKLQLMALTVDILKATEIGKAVNGLRKHPYERIRQLSKTLIGEWKDLVYQWVNTTKDIAGSQGTPDSENPSVVDEEEGLPSPPLDEGAFFTAEPTGLELSQFFDGMDDDIGNPRDCGEFNKNRDNERNPKNIAKRKPQASNEAITVANDNKHQPMTRQEAPVKPNKPSVANSAGPRRPLKQSLEQKVKDEQTEKVTHQRKPLGADQKRKIIAGQPDRPECSDEETKFESAKRRLQQSYQQHENAKRQRTIQVLETIPKQAPTQKHQFKRPGFNNRQWANNGRR